MRRVVVTGIGAVCSLGLTAPEFWERLCAGASGIAPIERLDVSALRNAQGGEVKRLDALRLPPGPIPDDLAIRFALAAAYEAVTDAALDGRCAPERAGIVFSTNFGSAPSWERFATRLATGDARRETGDGETGGHGDTETRRPGEWESGRAGEWGSGGVGDAAGGESVTPSPVHPFTRSPVVIATKERPQPRLRHGSHPFTHSPALPGFGEAAAVAAERFGFLGPRPTLSLSCSSGGAAIGWAMDAIRLGMADAMLAGGHDVLSLSALAGLSVLRTITAEKIRPFDKNRSGTIFGEGAGMLLLEERGQALARGARIYGEVCGAAVNNNAYHVTAPDKRGEGLGLVLRAALADAGLPPDAIDYVNAHATGTKYHDVIETMAIKEVLGERAYRIPVSSIKAGTAHAMAAAGSLEAIASLLAIRDGMVPPTLNYEEPDPECDLDCVPNQAREASVRCAASLSSGIGGNNAALILRRDDG